MNILPVDRALSIYGALADRAETRGARERLSKHLMKMFIDGEKDEHRLTVHGLSFLQTARPSAQVFRALLAVVRHDVVGHLGSFGQRRKTRLLDGRDMDEHVLGASVRLDETITLRGVKPLHCSAWHCRLRSEPGWPQG